MSEIAKLVFDNFYLLLALAAAAVLVILLLRTLAETLFGLQHLEFVSLDQLSAVAIAERKELHRTLLIDFSWDEYSALLDHQRSGCEVFDLSLRREDLKDRKWLDLLPARDLGREGEGRRPDRPWVITGLEPILMNRPLRLEALDMLEQLAAREEIRIFFFSEVSPLARLRQTRERERLEEEAGGGAGGVRPEAERESFRWSNLFADFTTFYGTPPPLPKPDWPADDAVDRLLNEEFGRIRSTKVFAQRTAARTGGAPLISREAVISYLANFLGDYYQRQWLKSTKEEHLAMHHLAHGRYINANNFVVLDNLMLRGLVRRDPDFQLMNESFAHWIRMLNQPEWFEDFRIQAERGGTWHMMRVPLLLAIVATLTVVAYLDRGGSGSLLALLPAVAAGIPLLLSQLTQARQHLGS